MRLLSCIYTDVKNLACFLLPWKLFKAVKKSDPSITLVEVECFWRGKSHALYIDILWCKVLAHGVGYQFQADLIEYAH